MTPQTRTNLGSLLVGFAMLGGAVAWLLHFLLIYAIGEFGCATALGDMRFLRITGVSWAILAVTVVMFAVALAALWVAHHNRQLIADPGASARANLHFAARMGQISNILFAAVILVETIPVLFYLGGC